MSMQIKAKILDKKAQAIIKIKEGNYFLIKEARFRCIPPSP
jgi:hypothetical protein